MKFVSVKLQRTNIEISNSGPLVLIAGPCVIEDEKKTMFLAKQLKKIAKDFQIPFVFKASYDKANRSSVKSFRGPGVRRGLEILLEVKENLGIPVLTDVHSCSDVSLAARVADIIQIPAFLCRQTDLIVESARTGLPVNVKKGQFIAPQDVRGIIDKIESVGNKNILLTERGTSFGYHNLVVDMRSFPIMKNTGYPVIFDASHSVQLPGGLKNSSGGEIEFVEPLAKAATAIGIAGIFLEVHPNPKKAFSDGQNSLALSDLPDFLDAIMRIDKVVKNQL